MKKRIKVIFLSLFMVFAAAGFTACGPKEPDNRTVLKIASWDFGTAEQNLLNRRMIKAFEQKYTDYRVEVISITSDYADTIISLAATRQLPDVFNLSNVTFGLSNAMLLELTDIADADGDWDKIPAAIADAGRFNGRIFAMPGNMNIKGLFVNDDIFEKANLDTLPINPTVARFEAALNNSALTKSGQTVALNNEETFLNWYASALNENMGYYTWDAENKKFHIDSDEFAAALSKMQGVRTAKRSFESLLPDERVALGLIESDDASIAFRNGKVAMFYGDTYERNGMRYGSGTEDIFEGDLRFVGTPGGRNIIVPDIWGVSAATQHAQMAYELAKWLSFSPEGILKRIELDDAEKPQYISLPLSNDQDVIDTYFAREKLPGLKEVYDTLDNAIVETVKLIPGYAYIRWDAPTGIAYDYINEHGEQQQRSNATIGNLYNDLWKYSTSMPFKWADHKASINKLVNDEYQNSVRKLNNDYPPLAS